MFEDFGQALYNGLRDEDMTVIFPDAIKSIVARDANFEFSTSVFLPPLHLSWSYNVAAETQAVVFIWTHLEGFHASIPHFYEEN